MEYSHIILYFFLILVINFIANIIYFFITSLLSLKKFKICSITYSCIITIIQIFIMFVCMDSSPSYLFNFAISIISCGSLFLCFFSNKCINVKRMFLLICIFHTFFINFINFLLKIKEEENVIFKNETIFVFASQQPVSFQIYYIIYLYYYDSKKNEPLKLLVKNTENILEDCSICLDNMEKGLIVKTICNHIFHNDCITQNIKYYSTCPLCRTEILKSSIQ